MSSNDQQKWEALGFKRKPFIDLGQKAPFVTVKREKQLCLLEELAQEGGHVLLLMGVSGVGKTCFLQILKKRLKTNVSADDSVTIGLGEIHGHAALDLNIIKISLCKYLGLEQNEPGFNFDDSLRLRLKQLHQRQEHFLLLIDDAHELAPEILHTLTNWVNGLDAAEQALSILFCGRMQLEHFFSSASTEQTWAGDQDWGTGSSFTLILEPLNTEEVEAYLKHGLRQGGYKGTAPFSKSELAELCRESQGILARLLVMTVDKLERKWRQSQPPKKWLKHPKMALGAVATVLILGMLAVQFFTVKPTARPVLADNDRVLQVQDQGPWVRTVIQTPSDAEASEADDTAVGTELQDSPEPTVAEETTSAFTPHQTVVVEEKVKPLPAKITVAAQNTVAPVLSKMTIPSKVAMSTVPAQTATAANVFKAQGYTLQIAGGYDFAQLQHTVCQMWGAGQSQACVNLPKDLHYIKTLRDNKAWYIAALGQYDNRAQANTVLHDLPESLLAQHPWVRPLTDLTQASVVTGNTHEG